MPTLIDQDMYPEEREFQRGNRPKMFSVLILLMFAATTISYLVAYAAPAAGVDHAGRPVAIPSPPPPRDHRGNARQVVGPSMRRTAEASLPKRALTLHTGDTLQTAPSGPVARSAGRRCSPGSVQEILGTVCPPYPLYRTSVIERTGRESRHG